MFEKVSKTIKIIKPYEKNTNHKETLKQAT